MATYFINALYTGTDGDGTFAKPYNYFPTAILKNQDTTLFVANKGGVFAPITIDVSDSATGTIKIVGYDIDSNPTYWGDTGTPNLPVTAMYYPVLYGRRTFDAVVTVKMTEAQFAQKETMTTPLVTLEGLNLLRWTMFPCKVVTTTNLKLNADARTLPKLVSMSTDVNTEMQNPTLSRAWRTISFVHTTA